MSAFFLRVSNPTGSIVKGVPAGNTQLYSDGTYSLQIDHSTFRYVPAGEVGSPLAATTTVKSKINGASWNTGSSWITASSTDITAGLVLEFGTVDYDGYFTAYFTS